MPDSRDGILQADEIIDGIVVHFERNLSYPPGRVWEQLLDKDHLVEWLTSEPGGHIRHRLGGEVHLPTVGGAVIESQVYEFVPEDTLTFGWESYDWDGGTVGWYLDREEGGTLLLFEHDDDALHPEHFARTLANWHVTLDRFEASLAGNPTSWEWDMWEVHYHRYEQRLLRLLQGGA